MSAFSITNNNIICTTSFDNERTAENSNRNGGKVTAELVQKERKDVRRINKTVCFSTDHLPALKRWTFL